MKTTKCNYNIILGGPTCYNLTCKRPTSSAGQSKWTMSTTIRKTYQKISKPSINSINSYEENLEDLHIYPLVLFILFPLPKTLNSMTDHS
uniref:Uncharacterized protein LOC105641579 n=1 Tax=Rhizophora mucronata TaxID=61149 RepID=A0A2P2PKC1_RHIMU